MASQKCPIGWILSKNDELYHFTRGIYPILFSNLPLFWTNSTYEEFCLVLEKVGFVKHKISNHSLFAF